MLVTVLGVVLLATGVAFGWYGLRPLVVLPKLLRTEPVTPSGVSTEDSFVVCRGTATAAKSTVAGPFTGTRCLGFEFEVTERQPFAVGIPWFRSYVDDGVATVPFRLQDDRGTLEVSPSSRRFSIDTESTVVTVGSREAPPERIQRFIDGRDRLSPVAGWLELIPGMGTRWYVERRIDPGEEYVMAGQVEREHGDTTLAGDLVITDKSPKQVAATRLKAAVFPLFIAVIFAAAGVVGLLL